MDQQLNLLGGEHLGPKKRRNIIMFRYQVFRLSTDNPLGASGSVLGGRTRAPPDPPIYVEGLRPPTPPHNVGLRPPHLLAS